MAHLQFGEWYTITIIVAICFFFFSYCVRDDHNALIVSFFILLVLHYKEIGYTGNFLFQKKKKKKSDGKKWIIEIFFLVFGRGWKSIVHETRTITLKVIASKRIKWPLYLDLLNIRFSVKLFCKSAPNCWLSPFTPRNYSRRKIDTHNQQQIGNIFTPLRAV